MLYYRSMTNNKLSILISLSFSSFQHILYNMIKRQYNNIQSRQFNLKDFGTTLKNK